MLLPFPQMRPLVALLAWDAFAGRTSERQRLLDCLCVCRRAAQAAALPQSEGRPPLQRLFLCAAHACPEAPPRDGASLSRRFDADASLRAQIQVLRYRLAAGWWVADLALLHSATTTRAMQTATHVQQQQQPQPHHYQHQQQQQQQQSRKARVGKGEPTATVSSSAAEEGVASSQDSSLVLGFSAEAVEELAAACARRALRGATAAEKLRLQFWEEESRALSPTPVSVWTEDAEALAASAAASVRAAAWGLRCAVGEDPREAQKASDASWEALREAVAGDVVEDAESHSLLFVVGRQESCKAMGCGREC